ncbi:hypothetical protein HMPREF3213_02808 [Heyndrickxia coagulans]|uniref:Uncharacterized protein n=1 Tax=Heyndrickxia coagulans TaxID=1398 RepID=A0A133KHL4_HEYCO|nr:hypothetical protein HMPREF3213_02808 [Heyndrickxia coagulans]
MGAASPSRKKWHSGKNLHTPLPVNSVYQPMRKTSRIRQRLIWINQAPLMKRADYSMDRFGKTKT